MQPVVSYIPKMAMKIQNYSNFLFSKFSEIEGILDNPHLEERLLEAVSLQVLQRIDLWEESLEKLGEVHNGDKKSCLEDME